MLFFTFQLRKISHNFFVLIDVLYTTKIRNLYLGILKVSVVS